MGQIQHRNKGYELLKIIELERLRLEVSINAELAIILKLADSPLIKEYFINPMDRVLEEHAIEEMAAYCRALADKTLFWVNDIDKIFYYTGHDSYVIDPDDPEIYWYNMSLYETELYNFNINYNPALDLTNLWINAPVFDSGKKPVGIVGTGINLSSFINAIYINYTDKSQMYFFNASGEITGADNINLVKNKTSIAQELGQVGEEILSKAEKLSGRDIIYYDTKSKDGVAIIGAVPALNWYITAVYYFSIWELLQADMTVLFAVMLAVIFVIFAVFNMFLTKLLKPLHHIVKEIGQISGEWDLNNKKGIYSKDEIETLGEFLNMTIIDQLTGIYNRRFFDGNMKKLIKSLSRTGGKLSLLMIDIDFFKKYNDTYGHDMGDKCLKTVSTALSSNVTREEDFAARYGGEEFAVVLPNTDENGAHLIADKLLKKVQECNIPHEKNDIAKCVTVSIGGTTGMVKFSQTESDYVKRADTALYESKQNGRNRYTFKGMDA